MIDNNPPSSENAAQLVQQVQSVTVEVPTAEIELMKQAQAHKQQEMLDAAKAVQLPVHQAIKNAVKDEQSKKRKGKGKSERRKQKAQKRNNNGWDEINGIAMACYQMLTIPAELQPLLKERKLLAKLKDLSLARRLIDAIVRDTRTLSTDFARIQKLHQGKQGHITSDTDLLDSYSIFTDYVNFVELSNSCLVPSLAHLSEMLGEAMTELDKEEPELVKELNSASVNYRFNLARKAMNELTGAEDTAEKAQEETA